MVRFGRVDSSLVEMREKNDASLLEAFGVVLRRGSPALVHVGTIALEKSVEWLLARQVAVSGHEF